MRFATLATALLAASPMIVAAQSEPPGISRAVALADRTATFESQRVRYLEAGRGDTLILLVHGWPSSADSWREVISSLATNYRVVAPDLRNIGGSTGRSQDYSKAALARDLHSFVKSLGARRVVIVGHDIGGMVGYAYARQFPADVAGVVMLDIPIPGFAPWDQIASSANAWHYDFHAQQPLAEQLVAGRQAQYFRYFVSQTGGDADTFDDARLARVIRAYQSPSQLSAGFGLYRTFGEDKVFNLAHRGALNVPLLVAGGDRGMGKLSEVTADGLRQGGASNVRTATIARSSHWMLEEQPAQVAGLIRGFAAKASSGNRRRR